MHTVRGRVLQLVEGLLRLVDDRHKVFFRVFAGAIADPSLAGLLLLEWSAVAVTAVQKSEKCRTLHRAAEVEAPPKGHLRLVLWIDHIRVARDAHVGEVRVVRVAELVLSNGIGDVLHLILHAADVLKAVLVDGGAMALRHLNRLEAVRLAEVNPRLPSTRLLLAVDVEPAVIVVIGGEGGNADEA